jgi:hypothetical protein
LEGYVSKELESFEQSKAYLAAGLSYVVMPTETRDRMMARLTAAEAALKGVEAKVKTLEASNTRLRAIIQGYGGGRMSMWLMSQGQGLVNLDLAELIYVGFQEGSAGGWVVKAQYRANTAWLFEGLREVCEEVLLTIKHALRGKQVEREGNLLIDLTTEGFLSVSAEAAEKAREG